MMRALRRRLALVMTALTALVLAGAEFVLVRALLANHALMAAARGGHTGRRS